jgi:hypothetical protein
MVDVNNVIFLIKPEDYPQFSNSDPMVSGPFPSHMYYIGMP